MARPRLSPFMKKTKRAYFTLSEDDLQQLGFKGPSEFSAWVRQMADDRKGTRKQDADKQKRRETSEPVFSFSRDDDGQPIVVDQKPMSDEDQKG